MNDSLTIQRIFHPTDLDPAGTGAFLHALRLAVASRSSLTVMHVDADADATLDELPAVRATLAQWGLLHDPEDTEGLTRLGIGVRKVISSSGDAVGSCIRYMADHPVDLIVLGTHQVAGRMGWSRARVAEPMTREAERPALFIPHGQRGFLDHATGEVDLSHILVPVAADPSPARAIALLRRLLDALRVVPDRITLLHVGDPDGAIKAHHLTLDPLKERLEFRQGPVVEVIVEEALRSRASLVVMPTKGHDGFLDALRGSTTERVLRSVSCPVLAVPA